LTPDDAAREEALGRLMCATRFPPIASFSWDEGDERRREAWRKCARVALDFALDAFAATARGGGRADRPYTHADLPPAPDDAPTRDVLRYALLCAESWDGAARIIGNLRAADLSRALRDTLGYAAKEA
jgi:hypothetical protein